MLSCPLGHSATIRAPPVKVSCVVHPRSVFRVEDHIPYGSATSVSDGRSPDPFHPITARGTKLHCKSTFCDNMNAMPTMTRELCMI